MLQKAIPVVHVSRSRAAETFYQSLGFSQAWAYRPDPAAEDPCYAGYTRDGLELHVSSFPGDGVPGSVIAFVTADVDRLHAELRDRNVEVAMPPTDQTWGNREMYVRDPDGNSLRFLQLGEPPAKPT